MGVNARMFLYSLAAAVSGTQNWGGTGSDVVKVALLKDTWTPDQSGDEKWADVRSHEITGTNYSAGGKTLTYPSPYYDYDSTGTPGGTMRFKADDITWATLTTDDDIKYAVVYSADGNENTAPNYGGYGCPLIGWVSFASNIAVTAEDFVIDWTNDFVFSVALDTANPSTPRARMTGAFWLKAFDKEIAAFDDGNWKVALVTSFAENQDTIDYLSDIIATPYASPELANTGNYTRKALANMTANANPATPPAYGGRYDFCADDTAWTNLTSSDDFSYAVIFYDTGDASTSPVLGWVDFGTPQSATNQNVTIEWDSTVVFQCSLSTAADV